jgi:hypothetical protein
MKMKLYLHLLLPALLIMPVLAHAQGSAFNYQGRLMDNGIAANGTYDFIFSVYDAEADGNALGAPVTRDAITVSAGQFVVPLDFGADVFTGPARWLQIGVRVNGAAQAHTTLAPRQALLPTPYAIFAGKAGGMASGTVTANQLNTGGLAPAPGQFLSYDGGKFLWSDPGVAVGDVWSRNGADAYYNSGKVGIGTTTPGLPLSVLTPSNTYGMEQTDGTIRLATFLGGSAGGGWLGTISNHKLNFFINNGAARMTVDTTGNIGIGTTTPASKLTVFTPSGGLLRAGLEHTDGTVRLGTYVESGNGAWLGTLSNHPLNFFVNDGLPSVTIDGSGTSIASGPGFVTVGSPNAESGTSIKRGNNRADVRFNGSTLKLVAAPGSGPPPSTYGIAIDTAGNVGVGTEAPLARLDVRGTTRTCVLTITGGCDLAEPFPMDASDAPKGSVVVIDDENPGRLKLSDRAYDTRVAGIVSGANGINPGISLQQEGVLEGGQNVALSGRVYVQADASFGAIKAGDLLTTSDTSGHAMKVADHAKAQGAILGKAMSALSEGQGMVLVLVTLQ